MAQESLAVDSGESRTKKSTKGSAGSGLHSRAQDLPMEASSCALPPQIQGHTWPPIAGHIARTVSSCLGQRILWDCLPIALRRTPNHRGVLFPQILTDSQKFQASVLLLHAVGWGNHIAFVEGVIHRFRINDHTDWILEVKSSGALGPWSQFSSKKLSQPPRLASSPAHHASWRGGGSWWHACPKTVALPPLLAARLALVLSWLQSSSSPVLLVPPRNCWFSGHW